MVKCPCRFIPYRRDLKVRSRELRREMTPAERKLWYEFLRGLRSRFLRQKPLGPYIADFYCAKHRLVIEIDGDSHFEPSAQRYDDTRLRCSDSMEFRSYASRTPK